MDSNEPENYWVSVPNHSEFFLEAISKDNAKQIRDLLNSAPKEPL